MQTLLFTSDVKIISNFLPEYLEVSEVISERELYARVRVIESACLRAEYNSLLYKKQVRRSPNHHDLGSPFLISPIKLTGKPACFRCEAETCGECNTVCIVCMENRQLHLPVSLIVYNTNTEDENIPKGVYCWDGAIWALVSGGSGNSGNGDKGEVTHPSFTHLGSGSFTGSRCLSYEGFGNQCSTYQLLWGLG